MDNPQAFPGESGAWKDHGMSLRDFFAGQALMGFMSKMGCSPDTDMLNLDGKETGLKADEDIATACYKFAEAMLKEREKKH